MRIAVCFKVIPDYDQVPSNNWKGTGSIDFKYVKKVFGMFDEGALETARRIKQSSTGSYLEAVSFGNEDTIFTESLYSVGYDKVVYIDGKSKNADAKSTASILAEYFKRKDFDVIICGDVVGPNETGMVPYHLAKLLERPIIDCIADINVINDKLVIERETGTKIEKYEPTSNIVGVISNAKNSYLKLATFKEKELAKEKTSEKTKTGCKVHIEKGKIRLPESSNRIARPIELSELIEILKEGAES